MGIENCSTVISAQKTICSGNYIRKTLVYHPSNSKKGIAIKGTNIRVSIFNYYGI